jgi:hypothetical protein
LFFSESKKELYSGIFGISEAGSLIQNGKVNFCQYSRSLHRLVEQSGPHLKKQPLPKRNIQPVRGKVMMAKTMLFRPPMSVNGIKTSFTGKMNTYANGLSQDPIKNLKRLLQITSISVKVMTISLMGHPIKLKVKASTAAARKKKVYTTIFGNFPPFASSSS